MLNNVEYIIAWTLTIILTSLFIFLVIKTLREIMQLLTNKF